MSIVITFLARRRSRWLKACSFFSNLVKVLAINLRSYLFNLEKLLCKVVDIELEIKKEKVTLQAKLKLLKMLMKS